MSTSVAAEPVVRPASPVQIEPVDLSNRKAIREIIEFPFKLYKNDPNWVPPFIGEREEFMDPKKNPFFEHARVKFFVARRNGEIVGTIDASVDEDYNRFHNEKIAGFGFFETIDDPEVGRALLNAAENWAREQGMEAIRGPLNFQTNHEVGLLIEGFEESPVVMMTYNQKYYARMIEDAGFTKVMDLYAYIGDLDDRLHNAPPKVFRVAEKVAQKHGIRIRGARMKDFYNEVKFIQEVNNEAWAQNWGFVPITDAEAKHLAESLRLIVDPDLVLVAETTEGEPIGVSLTLPDLHQALKAIGGGRMYPFGVLRFLWARRKINQIRMVLMGVKAEYRALGIDAIFYVETARRAFAKGHKRIEGSWVLESNVMMNRIIERLGGTRYKTYRIYQKQL